MIFFLLPFFRYFINLCYFFLCLFFFALFLRDADSRKGIVFPFCVPIYEKRKKKKTLDIVYVYCMQYPHAGAATVCNCTLGASSGDCCQLPYEFCCNEKYQDVNHFGVISPKDICRDSSVSLLY